MLKYLSGIENESDAAINGWFENAVNQVRGAFTNVVKNIQNFTSNLPKITLKNLNMSSFATKLKKVGVAPSRGAYLLLVSKNIAKMADRLADAYRINPAKVKETWVKGYGGNWDKLKAAINKGTKTAKINGELGEPVTATAVIGTIAAALPILAGTIALVKSIRGNRDAADAQQDEAVINAMAGRIDSVDISQINSEAPADTGGTFNVKNVALIGGAAVALYFITKKK